AFVGALLFKFNLITQTVFSFLQWMMLYNVWFAFFNLIPIPPLDGSKLLLEFMPAQYLYKYEDIVERYGFYILVALVMTGIVGAIINPLAQMYIGLVNSVLNFIF
ncbi:MAG: site-2 protease family protein, partial [Acidaminococcaceae bacterium]|nr:site-2 protease family protein [Acidaminococcaceae bacterium]